MKSNSASMLWELIGRLANNCLTFRISGEPGVGKEAIAHLIHRHYPHPNSEFIVFNCRELQDESRRNKPVGNTSPSINKLYNVLCKPENKVLYFKNIQLMPEKCQTELLDMLSQTYSAASPWIFTSSIAPFEDFQDGTLMPSLFSALDTVHIAVPPLRNHPNKIPQILSWFLHTFSKKDPESLAAMPAPHIIERLLSYEWPGNLRQLQQLAWDAHQTSDWESTTNCLKTLPAKKDTLAVDQLAAIYLMSLAKLSIHKEKIIEGFMVSSKMEEVGLLDLAIYHEAVSQIADHIDDQGINVPQDEPFAPNKNRNSNPNRKL